MAKKTENGTERKVERTEEEKTKLIHRLNRIAGQIRGVKAMLENDAYCMDVLVQSTAASAAMNAFNAELIAEHTRGCVAKDVQAGNTDSLEELLVMVKRLVM